MESLAHPAPEATQAPDGDRLRQIDIMRLLICVCVLVRHAGIAQYAVQIAANHVDRPVVGGWMFLGHFARNAFFFVSALVLVHAYAPRSTAAGLPDAAAARRRRIRLIGLPFLVWSAVYLVATQLYGTVAPMLTDGPEQPWARFVEAFPDLLARALLRGDASYQLYFLVVTCEFTLLFPLFLRLLHRTRGHHGYLLAGSFVLQIITYRCYAVFGMPGGTWRSVLGDASLFGYQFLLVAGGVAGMNVRRVHDWVTGHRLLVLAPLPPAVAGMLLTYRMRLERTDPLTATDAMNPTVLVFAVATLGPLYLAADWLARRRTPAVRTVLDRGARLSFGIYLVHPLVLTFVFLVWLRLGWSAPAAWQGAPATVLTLAGTVALCLVAHRSRFSPALIGRPRWTPPVR